MRNAQPTPCHYDPRSSGRGRECRAGVAPSGVAGKPGAISNAIIRSRVSGRCIGKVSLIPLAIWGLLLGLGGCGDAPVPPPSNPSPPPRLLPSTSSQPIVAPIPVPIPVVYPVTAATSPEVRPQPNLNQILIEMDRLGAQGQFSEAWTLGNDVVDDLASHPGLPDLQRRLVRLKTWKAELPTIRNGLRCLDSDSPAEFSHGTRGLIDAGEPGAIHLRLALRNPQTPSRALARVVGLLAQLRDRPSVQPVFDLWTRTSDPAVRQAAAGFLIALCQIGDPAMLKKAWEVVKGDISGKQLELALFLAGLDLNLVQNAIGEAAMPATLKDYLVRRKEGLDLTAWQNILARAGWAGLTCPGWHAFYFRDATWTNELARRIDAAIDLTPQNLPQTPPQQQPGNLSVRWQALLVVRQDGPCTFELSPATANGKLTIDGTAIPLRSTTPAKTTGKKSKTAPPSLPPSPATSQPVSLTRGLHTIQFDYALTKNQTSLARLSWSGPAFTTKLITDGDVIVEPLPPPPPAPPTPTPDKPTKPKKPAKKP